MTFMSSLPFLTNKQFMKKTGFLSALLASALLISCGGDGQSGNGTNGPAGGTTETTTVGTGETNTASGAENQAATGSTPSNTTGAGTGAPLSEGDQTFVRKAAMSGMMEQQSSQMAQERATDDRVKSFAAMMVRDHTQANQELMSLARSRGLMLPADSLDLQTQKHLAAMQKMQGRAFDKHFMQMMATGHDKDVAEFQRAANNLQDAELKGWAAQKLPVLKMHQDSAKAITKALK